MAGVPGQILLGALSDRIGREAVWTIACAGFAICYAALIGLANGPSPILLYVMVLSQGLLGYGVTAIFGPSSRRSSKARISARSSAWSWSR